MLNVRIYLEDIKHIIHANSTAQLKMFVFRYMAEDPNLERLLNLDRATLKLYLYYLRKEVLPIIEEHLSDMSNDPLH